MRSKTVILRFLWKWRPNQKKCIKRKKERGHISHELVHLSKASSKCKQHGAELASIHSYQENQIIPSLGGNEDIFIALSDSNI